MPYGICRIKKLKAASLNASGQHTQRTRHTPNADPDKPHICIIGQETGDVELETLVRQRIGKQTIRKNAVMAVEFLLSASPEYFRPLDPSEWGYYEPERLENFQTTAREWLIDNWGDCIVRAELHLDEGTPHIHAYFVPLDEKGKLNCRALFGTRTKLSKLQDSYAKAMSKLGLERGIKGSRATHTKIKQYYTATTQAPDLSLDAAAIQHQLADRGRILKRKQEMEQTAKYLSKQLEAKEYRSFELETSLEASEQKLDYWQQKYENLTKNTEPVSMQAVAYELGLSSIAEEGKQEKWGNYEQVFKITDTSFSLLNSATDVTQSSSVLDLVMQVNDCDFREAIIWLNDRFGETVALRAVDYYTREIIKQEVAPKFKLPVSDKKNWQQIQNYLVEKLGIPAQLVNKLHAEGLLYADSKRNLVSICRTLSDKTITGALLRSTASSGKQFTSLAPGSKRLGGCFYFESGADSSAATERVVLVDSALDALSMATLDSCVQKTMYVSLDHNSPPYDFLRSLPKNSVEIALGKNPASERQAHQIRQQLPKQTLLKRPGSVDWVTELQKAHEQKQQQLNQSQHLEQTQGREIKPNRGIRR
jgi:Plasmid recombination enzyme